jgi:hypothetical protein
MQHPEMSWRSKSTRTTAVTFVARYGIAFLIVFEIGVPFHLLAAADATGEFRKTVQPILTEFCYDCHGDGAKKGNVAFDELKSDDAVLNHELWSKVLKNLRAGTMPPEKKARPSIEQQQKLEHWVKYAAFGIDPKNPDPGCVTVRRLNRIEYRNTIRDLMGFDFKVEEELPPDDTGYGFDNIGDVLSISPLLLEKYMQAAEVIVAGAVPRVTWMVAETAIPGTEFRKAEGKGTGERMSFYDEAKIGTRSKRRKPATIASRSKWKSSANSISIPANAR